ncbi:hypothetical protein [Streptomyces sp. JB150]|uniref:hypothetical protein n=1 Tax=Streptomyces sp. JB150 TaxID=2714844 RepID=UPI001F10CC57|nr:hypothetical protein [Streptomyces sp. JB150]
MEWFEFFETSAPSSAITDERRSFDILITALSSYPHAADIPSTAQSITAKVGGVLSQRKDLSDPTDIRMLLTYKFQADARYADLLEQDKFQRYLTKRSIEISEARSGAKKARRR